MSDALTSIVMTGSSFFFIILARLIEKYLPDEDKKHPLPKKIRIHS
jgi:hypothetical protein